MTKFQLFKISSIEPARYSPLIIIWVALIWSTVEVIALSQIEPPDNLVHKVSITGPREVIRGGNEYGLIIHLVDQAGVHTTADFDRKILVTVDHGEVTPTTSMIFTGEEHVAVTYRSPPTVGDAIVSAESSGLEVGTWSITVVTSGYLLLIAAAFGGILGGLVRLYRSGVRRIRSRIVNGKLELGLLARGLFGSVFGVMLFLSVKFGVVIVFDFLEQSGGFYTGTRTFAFFMGVVGGFGGAHVLEVLLARILREDKQSEVLDKV